MSTSDAALREEIARLTAQIDQHRATGSNQASTVPRPQYPQAPNKYNPKYKSTYNTKPPFNPRPKASHEVILNGVAFQSSGKSLVRKPGQSPSAPTTDLGGEATTETSKRSTLSSTPTNPAATPPISSANTTANTQPLIRIKNGLVAASLYKTPSPKIGVVPRAHPYTRTAPNKARSRKLKSGFHKNKTLNPSKISQRRKNDKQCPRFTMHGFCSFGLTCPYKHDPDKLALCPLFLKGTCPHKDNPSACALSHDPTPERTPICSRFNSTGECWKGTDCLYPHIRVGQKEGVCRDFAVTGYCEKGAQCDSNHVKECPSFAATGKCDRAALKGPAKCQLPHVIRANKRKTEKPSSSTGATSLEKETAMGTNDMVSLGESHHTKKVRLAPGLDADNILAVADPTGTPGFEGEYIALTFQESDDEESGEDSREGDGEGEEMEEGNDDDAEANDEDEEGLVENEIGIGEPGEDPDTDFAMLDAI